MRLRRGLVCSTLLLLAGCGGSPERSPNVTEGPASGEALRLEAGDNVFSPQTIEADAAKEVTIEITNRGQRPHDFTIDELGVSTGVLQRGDVVTITFAALDRGVEYLCTLHRGMEGSIAVG